MSLGSLRFRSIVAASVSIVLALVIVGAGVDVLVSRHLHRSLDRSLRARAVEVAQLSASAPALLTAPGSLDTALGGEQASVEVVDRRGRLVARSLALGGRVLPVAGALHSAISSGTGRYVDAQLGTDPVRVFVAPLAEAGGPAAGGAVAVAASTRDLADTLSSVHLIVILAALVAVAIAALALTVLMSRALRPLGRLASAAGEIEQTGDPRRRLPESDSGDEITGLARTLNAMLASLERARERERRFLADASHELRTPLTALVGNVAYLRNHGASPELVADLEDDATRLARLADDLLTLSREESAAPPEEVVRLDLVAEEAAQADPQVDLVAPMPVQVLGDRAALERALANLVQNAHHYGPEDGRITVEVETVDDLASLSVSDEGPGLQPYEAERAFERFWRRGEGASGSGLGLAIVRATAERHGGRAYAIGSRFTIELPALRDLSEFGRTSREEASKEASP